MYIDNTSTVVTSPQLPCLLEKAQQFVSKQVDWLEDNGMFFSPRKIKLLICAKKESRRVRVHGQPEGVDVQEKMVLPTRSERLLGVYIEEDLSW